MATKRGNMVGLILGLAIISMGIMAVVSGEESAKGPVLWIPMLFGLYVIISNIIGLLKKPATKLIQAPVQPAK
ncbi:MAG: hypothetical protein KKE23_02595 [Nanoarchaeota archaeon]|nr:hypothetical protein [Nanoarchaeota archaeon]